MRTTDAVTERLVLLLQVLVDSHQLCLAPVQHPHGRCVCVVQKASVRAWLKAFKSNAPFENKQHHMQVRHSTPRIPAQTA